MKVGLFLGKETASGITARTFVGERSSSFSRGVDGIDEYDGDDDGATMATAAASTAAVART